MEVSNYRKCISGGIHVTRVYERPKRPQFNTDWGKCNMTNLMTHRGVKLHKTISHVVFMLQGCVTAIKHILKWKIHCFLIFVNKTTPEPREARQSSPTFSFSWIKLPPSRAKRGSQVLLFHFPEWNYPKAAQSAAVKFYFFNFRK